MTLIFISEMIIGGLRVIAGFFLFSRLTSAEKPDKRMITAGLTGGAVVTALGWSLPALCRMALEALWIGVCAVRLQKSDTRMGLFVSIFYEMAVSFWRFLIMAGMGIIFHSSAFLDAKARKGQAAVWLFHILLGILNVYLCRHQDMTGKKAFRIVSAIAVMGFFLVITLSEQTILALPDDEITMWTFFAVILLMAVLVFHMKKQYEIERELAELKSGQAEQAERDYIALNNAYAVNAKLFHDIHNHMGVLRQLLSHEKYAEALQYLDELQEPVREITDRVRTGDETADYLINSKAAAAEAYGIQMQIQVEFPRHTNIRSADFCAILGNLLDNALEAARQVPLSQQPFISLIIRRINQMLVIKVENSFAVMPLQEKGKLKTTKTESGLHGWGLQSARTAAEKYDGTLQTACIGSTFRAVATLSFQGVTMESRH